MNTTEALGVTELILALIGIYAILDKIICFWLQCGECERRKKSEGITCEEKYKDEIENITKEYHMDHPAVRDGKPVPCLGLDCLECDLNIPRYISCSEVYKEWLESEADPYKEEK